jgi:hypothetical protein
VNTWVIEANASKVSGKPLFDLFPGTLEEAVERAALFAEQWGYVRPKVRVATFDDLLRASEAP